VWCCSTCGAIYHKDYPRCPSDGAEVVMADRDPLLGSVIGHYTIIELVGEGGMGRVYLAHHVSLPNKRYAFKVLLGDHAASTAMRARFTREAERASQLDHPNVVKVVDFGQTQHGLLYIVMDYVEGPSLVTLIDDGAMAPARVVMLARAVCEGLVYAHTAGIVHRDLKPENILVTPGPDGPVPRLVDFGLALSIDQSDARLTESGMTMGTPAFAAPEQLAGKPIDHRADLYALGMTMFEMLTGGLQPFEGQLMEVVSARTTRDAPRLSQRVPKLGVPRGLEDVVARLTRRRPDDRYASARQVIEALDELRIGPEARRPTARIAAARASRRGWIIAGIGACGVAAAAAWYLADPAQEASGRGVAPVPVASAPVPAATDPVAVPDPPPAPRPRRPTARWSPKLAPSERSAAPSETPASELRPADSARELHARIDRVDVSGSLPVGDVRRAVERQRSALARCVPTSPQTVVAQFTIGEARRARDIHARGSTAGTNACIVSAFGDVRTEAAPDIGDVKVTVRIAFVVST
jgi:serine/threonine-protein kinase